MTTEKFRIEVIDFLPEFGKHKTGIHDLDGVELCVGDTVERSGQKFLIGYRYGMFVLKPPFTMSYISLNEGSGVKKLNQVTAVPSEYLIIGYTNEPFFEQVKHLITETI